MKTTYLQQFSNPENVFCYHYEKLNHHDRKLYRKLAEGMFSFRPSITLQGTTSQKVSELYEMMKLDLPAAFFDEGIEVTWYPVLCLVKVRPRYRFGQQMAEDILAEAMDRTAPLLTSCTGKTDLEKETLIHDWFCRNVVYDNDYAQKMGGSSFELAAPLLWGKGVCSGISKAAKFLFDQVGIRSRLMTGTVMGPGSWGPGSTAGGTGSSRNGNGSEDHCWLMVKIDGRHYHLDITFDMTTNSRQYFNLTDREILADRMLKGA